MKERIQRWIPRAIVGVIALQFALCLIQQAIHAASALQLFVIGALASCVAYFIRAHRAGRETRHRTGSTGERTPVMPRSKS
jgi:hypothetical protein